MTHRLWIAFVSAVLLSVAVGHTQHAQSAESVVPDELKGWQAWVLRGEEYRACPFLASRDPKNENSYRCAWPERLRVEVDARGGRFTQRWQVLAESWIAVPGNAEVWPREVRVNGNPAAVVLRGNIPQLRLLPGSYTIAGSFEWAARPESLPLPSQTALVDLIVDGQAVSQPERPSGALWLGKRKSTAQASAMDLQVFRLVRDESPVYLTTRIRLRIAGDAREETLARVLPQDFVPLALTSELPVRLEQDGRLRVQVRPGSYEIELAARGQDVATTLGRPETEGPWPAEEVWSFASNDRLRVVAPEGAEGIDPAQANVPNDWRLLPAFRMTPETSLRFDERSRGVASDEGNSLALNRALWLDFNHRGFTAVDTINGRLRRNWRLDMQAPFRLESARLGVEPLLITESGEAGKLGVELRIPDVRLLTTARTETTRGALAATGWTERFDDVSGTLNLPPGHLLLAVPGADFARGSWLERWGLWSVFGVLIVIVFVRWAAGWRIALVAAVAFALTYQEAPLFIWLWANLLAALAVARAAPEGRFQRIANYYRTASFVVLGLALLPFLWGQLRLAIHPQLELSAGIADFAPAMEAPPMVSDVMVEQEAFDVGAARPEAKMQSAPSSSMGRSTDSDMATSAAGSAKLDAQRYAPDTVRQAGRGIPAWRYRSYSYGWSGPVEPGQTVRFIYAGPVLLFFWRVMGVLALAALFFALARLSFGARFASLGKVPSPPSSLATVVALLAIASGGTTPSALAASTPDAALLSDLKAQLVETPKCHPNCAEISSAIVSVQAERLTVSLQASALTSIAIAVPYANDRWQLDDVSIDGRAALAMTRESDGSLWVPLPRGAHTVRLSGRLAAAQAVQLVFPQQPRAIEVESTGWAVTGITEARLVSGSLELTRERGAGVGAEAASLEAAAEYPAFVQVVRNIQLETDWRIETVVSRIAPVRAAITLEVPLLPGESVLNEGVQVLDGKRLLVGIAAGDRAVSWRSALAKTESLALTMAPGAARTEVWNFTVSPEWRAVFDGVPAVLPEGLNGSGWVFQFYPRPGEALQVALSRPTPAAGETLAIDRVTHQRTFGNRSSDSTLSLRYRSTQGGRHLIQLPADARVTAVNVDGRSQQLRPENGELSLPVLPGEHEVTIEWTDSVGAGFRDSPAPVDLKMRASNVQSTLVASEARWPLAAIGSGIGPVILYWSELIAFVLVALLLSRWRHSPLKFHEWLLLGLGLSTASWTVFVLVATWLFAVRWREQWSATTQPRHFNLVQLGLAGLTVIAVSALIFSGIRYGLLESPDMGVTGPGSGFGTFTWFNDQSESALPQPTLISVPLWVYRALMFAWALWIAVALVRWLKRAFAAWTSHGFWRGKVAQPSAPSA